jgi:hypothetical protein
MMLPSHPIHALLRERGIERKMRMTSQLAVLMQKMRSVEGGIETELAKRREDLRFRFENNRIVFEDEALRIHRTIKIRLSRHLLQATPGGADGSNHLFAADPMENFVPNRLTTDRFRAEGR